MNPNDEEDGKKDGSVDYIDTILNEIGGSFKRYQIINYIIFCIPLAISGTLGLSYVFTALNLDYRCSIPECDTLSSIVYKPDWLPNAVPFKNGKPLKCLRFSSNASSDPYISHLTHTTDEVSRDCLSVKFNRSSAIPCNTERLIYNTDEVSIVNEFDILCEENDWKLAMVGTINNIGRFIFTPFMGHLSDRFGRRTVLILGIFGSSTFVLVQSFSLNYAMFITFEFLNAAIGSITYSAAFVLALEWTGVKNRIMLMTLVTATYPLGQMFLGVTAMLTQNFRILLRIISAPGFFIITYIWLAPESIRWLVVNGKHKQVTKILTRAAKMNRMELSQNSLDLISNECTAGSSFDDMNNKGSENKLITTHDSIWKIFQNRVLFIRFLVCAFNWIANAFVSYGISLTSVSLGGDKYVNFILIALAGVPAMAICYFMLEKLGRRWCLSISLLIAGACIISSKLLPPQYTILSIVLFFIGKCFITVSFTSLYVYTSELWPTNLRHSIMSLCSTSGRIGSMLAPLSPLLVKYMEILPYLTFGTMSILASLLVLKLPETLNKKLPDTLAEAESIGLKKRETPSRF